MEEVHPQVIIVGAGLAGLRAAQVLAARGISYLILEGSDRIGGRLRSERWQGATVELGAQWVTGCSQENPIHRLAVENLHLEGALDEQDLQSNVAVRDCTTGKDISEEARPRMAHLSTCLDSMSSLAEERYGNCAEDEKPVDISMRSALIEVGWPAPCSSLDRALEWLAVDFEYGESAESTSVRHNVSEEYTNRDFGDDNFIIADERGFDSVAKVIFGTLDPQCVKTGHVVSKIVVPRLSQESVIVHTTGGHRFEAAHLMLTVSVGVLKSGVIEFEPELPAWKLSAISDLAMTSYVKVFAQWERRWWDSPEHANSAAEPGSPEKPLHTALISDGEAHCWRLMSEVHLPGHAETGAESRSRMLCMTVVGEEGRRVQGLTDSQVADELTDVLSRAFPSCVVPRPLDVLVPRWDQDPLFQGAYSFLPTGALPTGFQEVQRPIGESEQVWFAGEACHSLYSGYLQGAYLSGGEVAEQIAVRLEQRSSEKDSP